MTKEVAKRVAQGTRTPAEHEPQVLVDFAEELGAFLGNTERKASEWLNQRKKVAAQLAAIRDKAGDLLAQLGHAAEAMMPVGGGRKANPKPKPTGSAIPPSIRSDKNIGLMRRPISDATRVKMAEAARRRWSVKGQGGPR